MKFLALTAVFSGLFVGGCINKASAFITDTSPVSMQSSSQEMKKVSCECEDDEVKEGKCTCFGKSRSAFVERAEAQERIRKLHEAAQSENKEPTPPVKKFE